MFTNDTHEYKYWKIISEIGSLNEKWEDTVNTKTDIIFKLINSFNVSKPSVLFASFNPIALSLAKSFNITIICSSALESIFDFTNVTRINDISSLNRKFDIVVALDEYFTYADCELSQRALLDDIAKVTGGWLITTLQDYKNFAPHKKNQIDAMSINSNDTYIMLENSVADKTDKQLWDHHWCCIKNHLDLRTIGPIARRTMYFKQLAKYCSDAGSRQYVIQKNLLYKGFFSKGFEHVITVNFQ